MYWPIISVNFANARMPIMSIFPLNSIMLVFLLSQKLEQTSKNRFQWFKKMNREGERRHSLSCTSFFSTTETLPVKDRKEKEGKSVGCARFA